MNFEENKEEYNHKLELPNYLYPQIDLLESNDVVLSTDEVLETKEKLMHTLQANNIDVSSLKTTVGYTNTLYEMIPPKGLRLSRLKGLHAELSFNMGISDIFIEPLYERGSIGFIIPNKEHVKLPIKCVFRNQIVLSKLPVDISYGKSIHPSAVVSEYASVDMGTVVMQGAIIQASAVVGKHCIINTGASVDHDCIVGDFVHISPHATLCGDVTVGEGSWIAAGATIIPGVKIGKWCIIGAGSVVTRDIPDYSLAAGNRCKVIKRIEM